MLPLLERIRDQWQRLPTNRRIGLLVIVVGIIGTVVLWGVMSSQVTYAVAFSDLQPADASAVASKLGELQIPYQLEDGTGGTTTIRVPASLVSEARVQVAGAGILKGSGVGYEIFNQPSFGLSDFIQQVDYQRALEGELARSISQIDGIDSARVHLAIPQPSVFLAQQRDPSAAVVISLKPGYQIDRAHAQAIVDLVVGAVQGMKASQVVLLDTSGNLLHQTQDSTGGNLGALDDHFAVQQSLERNLTSQLQDMLDRVVGPGHSTVQVNVQLDWTSGDTTTDIYSPNGQQPQLTSDQELKEYLPPGSGSVGGVATSLPTYQSITTTAALTSTNTSANGIQREQSNRTFQLSHTIQKTQLAPGTISRVSVAIAVDSNVADTTMIDNLTKMAQGVVGYDSQRGDVVNVVPVAFKQVPGTAQTGQGNVLTGPWQYLEIARVAALIVGPVLAILVLAFLLRRRGGRAYSQEVVTMPVNALPPPPATASPASAPAAQDSRRAFMRQQLAAIAEKDPAYIASVLQSWVRDDIGD